METKHTPGPWKFDTWHYATEAPRQELIVAGEEFRLAVLECDFVGDNPYTVPKEQAEANARLIAAAPELLAALEGMIEWARRVRHANPGMEVVNAINAIAKATGEPVPA